MRILDFDDGFTSSQAPTIVKSSTNELQQFVDDDAFLLNKNDIAAQGDIYFNTTKKQPRYFNGTAWVYLASFDENNNLTIEGNLVVQGTTTTINADNLNVKDRNITLNLDGDDSSAQGSGLTIERSGVDGSVIFDNSAASKWKVGLTGSEVEVVTTTNTQTLTNKTLTSPVINTPTGIMKSDVGLGNVDNTSDANKPVSTAQSAAISVVQTDLDTHKTNTANPHSVTKAQVGLGNVDNTSDATKNSAAAVLTNKDIDGGTASDTSRITLPKNTKTNLDSLTRKQGTLFYSTTDNKLYFDDGVNLFPLSSEAGSVPTGTVLPYSGSTAPSGYLLITGSSQVNVSRTTYAALFGVVGTTYGEGDGSTTFGLPNPSALGLRFAGSQTLNSVDYTATLGQKRNDAIQNITGGIAISSWSSTPSSNTGAFSTTATGGLGNINGPDGNANNPRIRHNFDASRVVRTDTQTHGADLALNAIIKY